MNRINLRRSRALGAIVLGLPALWLMPAKAAEPIPPACNPTVSGVGVPGCPSVLLGEVGDHENPTISFPDLVPDVGPDPYVAYESIEYDPVTNTFIYGPPQLYFDTYSQNLGQVPLQLNADDATSVSGSPVSQCVSWTTNLLCRKTVPVGGFEWHDDHKHYHYQDFAAYELRTLTEDGEPDYSDDGLISTSPKVSFCLMDSLRVRDDSPIMGRYNTCNPVEGGISPGWTDIYTSDIEGQHLSLEDSPDGQYALVVSLDTANSLYETNDDNNRVVVIVEVSNLASHFPTVTIVSKGQ